VNAYALFFQSVPVNFYCWFALALALVCVLREFNPGPMGAAEAEARRRERPKAAAGGNEDAGGHWAFAVVPVLVLAFSIPALAYVIGAESVRPFSLGKFARAYGAAESHVPQILVLSSLLAALVAAIPVVLSLGGVPGGPDGQSLAAAAVAAVFSGAVFGDHCSPFSDTTIVSSIAAGVEPLDHVRTQLPFAGIAAAVAALTGFLPLGYGVPGWVGMLAGVGVLVALPSVWRLGRRAEGGGLRAVGGGILRRR